MFPNAKIWKHFYIFTYINKLVDNNKMIKIGRGFLSIINGKRMTMNNKEDKYGKIRLRR